MRKTEILKRYASLDGIRGFLGFEKWNLIPLPQSWYHSLFTAYFGFPNPEFHSTDYFSLFPWIFLFLSGYFLYRCLSGKHLLDYLKPSRLKPLELMGQNSLGLYLLHQPVLYLVFSLLFTSGFQGDGPQSWPLPAG